MALLMKGSDFLKLSAAQKARVRQAERLAASGRLSEAQRLIADLTTRNAGQAKAVRSSVAYVKKLRGGTRKSGKQKRSKR